MQQVILLVVLGSLATCGIMLTTVISSGEDLRRSFQDDKFDKTFTNINQTKVINRTSSILQFLESGCLNLLGGPQVILGYCGKNSYITGMRGRLGVMIAQKARN